MTFAASAGENKLRGLSGGKESFDILFYAIYFHLPHAIQENVLSFVGFMYSYKLP
jgi:hypothetical protein